MTAAMPVGRVNETCAQCHREQSGRMCFEHEALREGCTTCHNVHGSINPKMLVERDNNLCLKCHAQVASPVLPTGTLIGPDAACRFRRDRVPQTRHLLQRRLPYRRARLGCELAFEILR